MKRTRHSPEQIIAKLREADALLGGGASIGQVCQKLGVAEASISKFHGDLRSQGVPVAKDTLHQYLAHLEDALLLRTVSVAGGSERRRMVNPRKVYPIDPGLIPVYDQPAGRTSGPRWKHACCWNWRAGGPR